MNPGEPIDQLVAALLIGVGAAWLTAVLIAGAVYAAATWWESRR